MQRRGFLRSAILSGGALLQTTPRIATATTPASLTRPEWIHLLHRVAEPVMRAAAEGNLQREMAVESARGQEESRRRVTHLEAVGRTLAGLAPWLEHGPEEGSEGELRRRYLAWTQAALATGTDPQSPGYLRFGEDRQTIVDAGFLSLALARAPRTVVAALPGGVRRQLAAALRATRRQTPPFNNWLLFAAMVEAALSLLGEEWDRERVDYALREHASWYLGDGVYGDGPHFHADFYDSFVIHPFLLGVLRTVGETDPAWAALRKPEEARARRYAAIQERTIGPDGSFPAIGRSLAYRCGAFHLLAEAASSHLLPETVAPAQARCALSAAIQRTLAAPETFDAKGWLRIGLCGHQPAMGETYISTGSLYLCTAAFLPLGLPPDDAFWSAAPVPWTAVRVWSGQDVAADHAIEG